MAEKFVSVNKLPKSFYTRTDTLKIARELLGKMLVTNFAGKTTSGIIVETEAYCGTIDRGCHAHDGRRTPRNEVMFAEGGVAYVYICYGIHHLFNVVTHSKDEPHAVLIRGVEPVDGKEIMIARRQLKKPSYNLTAGPGNLSMALGIVSDFDGEDLQENHIWVEDVGKTIQSKEIKTGPRIGMNFPGKYSTIPWRFYLKGNPWVSKPT